MKMIKPEKRVLIAEDSLTQATELRLILEAEGIAVEVEANGAKALERLTGSRYDLVLSDVMMPVISGYELCERIKANPRGKGIPVILLTELNDVRDILNGLQCGANGFVTKPYDSLQLVKYLKRILQGEAISSSGLDLPVELTFKGKKYSIQGGGGQVIGFLLSTYEALSQTKIKEQEAIRREKDREEEVTRALAGKAIAENELKMVQASKMSALGEMSAEIAHEINGPLSVLSMSLQNLRALGARGQVSNEELLASMVRMEAMTEKIVKIIRALGRISRNAAADPFAKLEIKQIVEDTLELCRDKFRLKSVDLRLGAFPSDLAVDCRASQICQVLLNLLNNAQDAVECLPEKWVSVETVDKGDFLQVWVTDSGKGIPEEIKDKLLEPFFSTKEVGKGTGLGLSISKRLIEEHNGTLTIDGNCPNTRFIVTLPKSQAGVKKAA